VSGMTDESLNLKIITKYGLKSGLVWPDLGLISNIFLIPFTATQFTPIVRINLKPLSKTTNVVSSRSKKYVHAY